MKRSAHAAELDGCPICFEDWNVDHAAVMRACCSKAICIECSRKLVDEPCPLCRTPFPDSAEQQLALLRRNVTNENAAAIRHLGQCYRFGKMGLAKDEAVAAVLCLRAADLGDVHAMVDCAEDYDHHCATNSATKEDSVEAIKYYQMAADRGHAHAQFRLGEMIYHCDGAEVDYPKAFRLFKMAAEKIHDGDAENYVGQMYEEGQGVARDTVEAIRWYKRSVAKFRVCQNPSEGNGEAEENLIHLLKGMLSDQLSDRSEPLGNVDYQSQKLVNDNLISLLNLDLEANYV